MNGYGYYPAGAADDPRAPFNEPRTCACKSCRGTGYKFYAYDLSSNKEYEVTEEEYQSLYEDEDEAADAGIAIIKGDEVECDECQGIGEVEI